MPPLNFRIPALVLCVFFSQICSGFCSQVYIVYLGGKTSDDPDGILEQNHQMLASVHEGSLEKAKASVVYSYHHGFRGFSAKLTEAQASILAKMDGVVSVFPNVKRRLHTTHSWDFMGLINDESMEIPGFSTKNQENIIVGFIDTGIWPEAPSFSDQMMPPVPSRWKGRCQTGEAFNSSTCNRKVIGARYYLSGYEAEQGGDNNPTLSLDKTVKFKSPRDSNGHGSHTASIATGRYVENMNFNGLASGGARGGAPMSRIAAYKACWDSGCFDSDIMAAFDDAIKDRVDILSVSLGPDSPQGDYFNDAISIGSFHAVSHGITVVSSAGNEGNRGTATNLAPWMITVAAGSTDREFTSDIILGNNQTFTGDSLTITKMKKSTTVISASDTNAGYFTPYQSSFCLESSLNSTKVRGKVLVCRHAESSSESKLAKSLVVKEAGGVGMILIDEVDKGVAIPFAIPAAIVGAKKGTSILSYINHTRNPTSRIEPAKTIMGSLPAPRVAAFSSKGPNSLTPNILKPDIMAPGLNILAAWSPASKKMESNILSGTSMACPHVTGIVALIKAVHPTWSPSAIKSALMTTATIFDKNGSVITVNPEGRPANPFDFGAGFMRPERVLNPGLIYDSRPNDFKDFLCSIGYDNKSLRLITGDNSICTKSSTDSTLNYPSITVPDLRDNCSITRTVTNVGKPKSIYRAMVSKPAGVEVTVVPKLLTFKSFGEEINFTVNFRVVAPYKGYSFGSLAWKRGKVRVTSALVVRVGPSGHESTS